ncbi:MAG: hypothetical protein QM621_09080 [Aeromicrobium sp.]
MLEVPADLREFSLTAAASGAVKNMGDSKPADLGTQTFDVEFAD